MSAHVQHDIYGKHEMHTIMAMCPKRWQKNKTITLYQPQPHCLCIYMSRFPILVMELGVGTISNHPHYSLLTK